MTHDLKRHYDGYDAKCRKCGATYRAFCCMNVGGMCNKCFQRVFAAFLEAQKTKRLGYRPLVAGDSLIRKLDERKSEA